LYSMTQQNPLLEVLCLIPSGRMTVSEKRKVFTVARLNQDVQTLLQKGFGVVWVQAELSNFSRPASGHWYFSLKDSQAQIRCAMFAGRNRYLTFEPEAGDEVLVRGKLGLYAARGDFQLIVEHMEPTGAGALQAEFDRLRKQLEDEGWFSAEYKQELPYHPATIGVVTSKTGAAIQDVLTVLQRRYPVARVIIYPTPVQGKTAAKSIAAAIETANARAETDVLLLVRGGGSLEDLWAFNEMPVATAISNSDIPIVSGVGHEVDTTIADLVADQRAATPSAAAELVTPDGEQLAAALSQIERRLLGYWQRQQSSCDQRLQLWQARLNNRHPERLIQQQHQRIDELDRRQRVVIEQALQQQYARYQTLSLRLSANSPQRTLEIRAQQLRQLSWRLNSGWKKNQQDAANRLTVASRALHSVSPLATLDRGFAIVQRQDTVIREAKELKPGDTISARLGQGSIDAEVIKINPKND